MNLMRLLVPLVVGCALSACSGGSGTPQTKAGNAGAKVDAASIDANNRGVGLMGKFQFNDAAQVFRELLKQHPDWLDAKVNLAIATFNRQAPGDEESALTMLKEVLAADPKHPQARYCAALLLMRSADPDGPAKACELYRSLAEDQPNDAYVAYRVAQCARDGDDVAEAIRWLERAIQIDPHFRSAYYNAFQVMQRSGQPEKAEEYRRIYDRLKSNPLSRLLEEKYTRMGPLAEVIAVDLPKRQPRPLPAGGVVEAPQELALEGAAVPRWSLPQTDVPMTITAVDFDHDCDLDLLFTNAVAEDNGAVNAVFINTGTNRFRFSKDHPLAHVRSINAVLWGDFDNDGLTDVYFCRRGPNQLWRQHPAGTWTDVTEATGTSNGEFNTVDGAFADLDHDADLDIFCVNADGPNELLNNNLDGTFQAIGESAGLTGGDRGSSQVVVTDLDRDFDADIVVIHDAPPHDLFINNRTWSYEAVSGFDEFVKAPCTAAVAADLDADGQIELITRDSTGAIRHWRPDDVGIWKSTKSEFAAYADASPIAASALAIVDLDGSSVLEVLNLSDKGLYAWTAASAKNLMRAAIEGRIDAWVPVVLNPGHGPSIVAIEAGAAPRIWNPGPGRHAFIAISTSGKNEPGELDPGQTMRSNASGIGAFIKARVDSQWTAVDTFRNTSGPGQSLQPIAIGTAGFDKIDFISIDWSDGVLQSEIDLEAGVHHRITETQRQTSSCPVLFVWNGEKFEFVSDILGVGGIGYMVAPGEYAPPRPWENFLLAPGTIAPREGRFVMKLGEPMEEACYLDAAALVAYDVPPGWTMTLDERMSILGPEPTGEPRFYRNELQPARATNERAEDVTETILQADFIAAPVGELDHRFIGRLKHEHELTVEFTQPIDAFAGEPMLVIDGWVEYPYSQTMFAAWQAGATYEAPTLEARDPSGQWQIIHEQFGYPAGMPRQMSVPLTNLPEKSTALRLRTNQEIYWDRIIIAFAEPCPEAKITRLPLAASHLAQVGFALRTNGPQRRPQYDYDQREPFWDTRYQDGLYTAFGSVSELIANADGALAIFGPGEEVEMSFDAAPLADLPLGWTRRFVLESAGWCKDMDMYTKDGVTLDPLPGNENQSRRSLHEQFQKRHVSGRSAAGQH